MASIWRNVQMELRTNKTAMITKGMADNLKGFSNR
jgi:hypothetical protein